MQDTAIKPPDKPAPIDSVPVLPYSIIEGQLDQSDPVWLGRISAALVAFLFAMIAAFVDDLITGLSALTLIGTGPLDYYVTFMMQGAGGMSFAIGCILLTSRECDGPHHENHRWWVRAIPAMAILSIVINFACHLFWMRVPWFSDATTWQITQGAAVVLSLLAGVLAGILLLEIVRRIPNLVLARQTLAAIVLMAGIRLVDLMVNHVGAWLNLAPPQSATDPLPRLIGISVLVIELFVIYTMIRGLLSINAAAVTARWAARRADAPEQLEVLPDKSE